MHNKIKRNRLVLPSLLIATISTYPPSIVAAVLLTEISNDLNIPVGIGGQLRTAVSIVAFFGSIAMTFISSRYHYKRLLTIGLLVIAVSSFASSMAPSFSVLLLATILTGAGMAIVVPMTTTLIAEYFTEAEQGRAISLLGMGGGFGFLLGGTIVGQIAAIGGWRLAYIGFAGTLGMLGLIFTYFALPVTENMRARAYIQVEGTAKVKGHPFDDSEFIDAYKKAQPEFYDQWRSGQPPREERDLVLVEINPSRIAEYRFADPVADRPEAGIDILNVSKKEAFRIVEVTDPKDRYANAPDYIA